MHIYTHDACLDHAVQVGHPERPERLQAVLEHLEQSGLSQDYPLRQAPSAHAEDILRAHPQSYVAYLESMQPDDGVVPLDPDTWMGSQSLHAAIQAAGAVCAGVDDLLSGKQTARVFCAVRPPGHHAESDAAMGFCLLNSIAIGAHKALAHRDVERVAILDFDVHHGNGTVEMFQDRPEVLVCSSFQHPYYPHRFHEMDETNIVNTPLRAGSGSQEFRSAIEALWLPAVEAHAPDIILVSAGFDAHTLDPLASINLTEEDFAWVTREIVQLAAGSAQGRILSTLEGGYDLQALAKSVEAHLTALAP